MTARTENGQANTASVARRVASKTPAALAVMILLCGCAHLDKFKDLKDKIDPKPAPIEVANDLDGVTILGPDVRGWPVTAALSVSFSGGTINLAYDKARVWPAKSIPGGDGGVTGNANPWVIAEINGQLHAATWEWLRGGQTAKPMRVVNGAHIKARPFPSDWKPRSGERLGFFVSGLARGSYRNVSERSNVVWVNWP